MHGKFPFKKMMGAWLCAALVCLLSACAAQDRFSSEDLFVPETQAEALQFAASLSPAAQGLASWQELAPGIAGSLAYVNTKNPEEIALADGYVAVTWGEMRQTLLRLQQLLPQLDAKPSLLATEFQWLRLSGKAHFSGYYEAEILASRTPKPGYIYPLYKVPADLKNLRLSDFSKALTGMRLIYRTDSGGDLVPYYNREDIDTDGALKGRGLELVWLTDPLDRFFLHVQGSGRLRFEDGSVESVLYAADNGRPYTAIGQVLSGMGLIDPADVSMQSLRRWITAHPDLREKVLNKNERYVFFHMDKTPLVGSMNKPLTPQVSMAVDRTTFPLGSVMLFSTPYPQSKEDGVIGHGGELRGVGLAQDTGGAIKLRRVDIFCGSGEKAALEAGHLNAKGPVWLLLPR